MRCTCLFGWKSLPYMEDSVSPENEKRKCGRDSDEDSQSYAF